MIFISRITKKEFYEILQINESEYYLLMPNEIFNLLIKDEELNDKKSPDVAFAYSYLTLITWLYRYTKYGTIETKNLTQKSLLLYLGISLNSKEYSYITKKDGILDNLGLTNTLSFKDAPISWELVSDDYSNEITFTYIKDYCEILNNINSDYSIDTNLKSPKRFHFKFPILAIEQREVNRLELCGTFSSGGKDYTHNADFRAFIECMSNKKLGYKAFYLLSFLKSRMGANKEVEISLEGISKYSGFKPTTRDKYLKELKAFSLIGCQPENYCIERGRLKSDANLYWINDFKNWKEIPNYDFEIRKVFHVTQHPEYKQDEKK